MRVYPIRKLFPDETRQDAVWNIPLYKTASASFQLYITTDHGVKILKSHKGYYSQKKKTFWIIGKCVQETWSSWVHTFGFPNRTVKTILFFFSAASSPDVGYSLFVESFERFNGFTSLCSCFWYIHKRPAELSQWWQSIWRNFLELAAYTS